tara:strand:- start:619 stop:849 length:231 start_codon:yes stop_codon:yes gene_type:complete
MKKNALKELADMMTNNPTLLDDFFADTKNQIKLKKFHIKEARNLMKKDSDMIPGLEQIIDDLQAEIDALLAVQEAA